MAKQKTKPVKEQLDTDAPGAPIPIEEGAEVVDLHQMGLPEEIITMIEDLSVRLDEAIAGRQRALADFKNLQRRSRENEAYERAAGVSSVVKALIPALDHFDIALAQDHGAATVEQLLDGVRIVREELGRALEGQRVKRIAPDIGEPFDPNLHQGIMRDLTDKQPPDTIVAVHQVGYAIGEMVLRPAAVVIAAPCEEPDVADDVDGSDDVGGEES